MPLIVFCSSEISLSQASRFVMNSCLGDRAGYAQVNQLRALIFDGLNLLFEFFNMRIVGVYGKHGLNDRKQISGDFLFL